MSVAPEIVIERIGPEHDTLVRRLYQYYIYDMSEWFGLPVQPDGTFAHDIPPLWRDGTSVFLARFDGQIAGFAIEQSAEKWLASTGSHDVKDFFVLRAYRRKRVASAMASHLWTSMPGEWLVRVLKTNRTAMPFWRETIRASIGAPCVENTVVDRDREWTHFLFSSVRAQN